MRPGLRRLPLRRLRLLGRLRLRLLFIVGRLSRLLDQYLCGYFDRCGPLWPGSVPPGGGLLAVMFAQAPQQFGGRPPGNANSEASAQV